jgi:hypothetical protein
VENPTEDQSQLVGTVASVLRDQIIAKAWKCKHLERKDLFGNTREDYKIYGQPEDFELRKDCLLCQLIYPLWKAYAEEDEYQNKAKRRSTQVKLEDLDLEQKAESHIFAVRLFGGEYGEAYHVLICSLLISGSENIHIRIDSEETKALKQNIQDLKKQIQDSKRIQDITKIQSIEKEIQDINRRITQDITELKDLFNWYKIPLKPKQAENAAIHSKAEATKIIAAAFRSSSSGKHISEYLLHQLNTGSFISKICEALKVNMPLDYCLPSYVAEDWLNRYFWLTQKRELPKEDQVSRLAVIHIRRSASGFNGHVMNPQNLQHVAESIRRANEVANQAKEGLFSHIILYGDFDYDEVPDLKKLVGEHINSPAIEQVEILFISRPWESASINSDGMNGDVNTCEFWKSFRDKEFDHIPIQVKILAIWNCLRVRYVHKVCIIGHRSGFIEAASFLQIPTFYLNNERLTMDKEVHPPGELLWKPVESPKHDRLRELADVMDTLIPVEALETKPIGKVLRIDKECKDDLAAALFMYMCWAFEKNITTETATPGWVYRVSMMHRQCEGHDHDKSPGKYRNDSYHSENEPKIIRGQRCLEQRYLFASTRKSGISSTGS